MNILDLLKGKKVNVTTNAKVAVQLIIDSVEEKHHSKDIGPSTAENDWWPETKEWTTFEVKFTNGFQVSYGSISEIELIAE